jgi:parallel beta-helix repeat protein
MKQTLDKRSYGHHLLLTLLLITGLAWPLLPVAPVLAQQAQVPIRYASSSRTIYLGAPYNANNTAEAPYVGCPSCPGAPKMTITLAQLAAALTAVRQGAQLTNLGNGVWLLKANVVIEQNTRLEITAADASELRLESILVGTTKQFVKMVAKGGQIYINGVRVHSWNTPAGTVDTTVDKGRSYLVALDGARMDILNAEMSYLGWYEPNPNTMAGIGKGEPSGLAWKRRATASRPESGPTGNIINSLIHHNYYGNYTWQAYRMTMTGNKVYANHYYGFDPHDDSNELEIAYNEFYNNKAHGLILSRYCIDNKIHHNKSYNNGKHGFMLDRGTNHNEFYANEAYNNGEDGLAISQSSNNLVRDNVFRNNTRYGIRLTAKYDAGDVYDGLTIDNIFENNLVEANGRDGIFMEARADRNTFVGNTVRNNTVSGIYVRTGGNTFRNNTITGNTSHGLYVLGSAPIVYTPGVTPVIPAVDKPGNANQMVSNTVNTNRASGVALRTLATNSLVMSNTINSNTAQGVWVDGSKSINNRISRNSISNNGQRGIYLQNSANGKIAAPVISQRAGNLLSGIGPANATIEVFSDPNGEGESYKGTAATNSTGLWNLTLPAGDASPPGSLTATATSSTGNSSQFSTALVSAATADENMAEDAAPVVDISDDPASDRQVDDGTSSTLATLAGDVPDVIYHADGTITFSTYLYLPMVEK